MTARRWLRIIPVALIMYTISYVDRTNVSLALDPEASKMMKDLRLDDRMVGEAAGVFFFGYMLLQIPGGYLAARWSARKTISLCLAGWGFCAIGCGLAHTFRQFEAARFLLGVAESGVFPSMLVLLANWFPRSERARANAYWNLCQPLAVVASALVTGALLETQGWRTVIVLEGMLPFVWLPIWWFFIRDHPREAEWISAEERVYLERTLREEATALEPPVALSFREKFCRPAVLVMIAINFLHNAQAYGCMTFFTRSLHGREFRPAQYGILFALPYALTAVLMVLVSRHSDKTNERRMHVAVTYVVSGASLILSVMTRGNFWLSYGFLCLSIPGPSVALAPFWAIPSETLPHSSRGPVMGLVNACGNMGGFAGIYIVGWLSKVFGSTAIPFDVLGVGILIAAGLSFLLPKAAPVRRG